MRGCLGESQADMEAVADLILSGALRPVLEEVPFADLNAGLRRLEEGGGGGEATVEGRLWTRPRKGRE